MTHTAAAVVALCLIWVGAVRGQFLAEDYIEVARFNNTPYFEGPGGWQRVLYEDATSDVVTNMVLNEIHIEPCGVELFQVHNGLSELSYILQGVSSRPPNVNQCSDSRNFGTACRTIKGRLSAS